MYKFMENHIAVSGGTEPTALTSWLPVLCFFKPRSCYPQTVLCVSRCFWDMTHPPHHK